MMQKKNYRYRITYLLSLVLFLLGALFYRQSFFAVLFLILLLLPFISIGLLLFVTRRNAPEKIRIHVDKPVNPVTAGNDIIIKISLENSHWMPFLNCQLLFTAANLFYENSILHTLTLPAEPKRTNSYQLPFHTSYAGLTRFQFTEFHITDFLHLYTKRIHPGISFDLPVLPNVTSYSEEIKLVHANDEDEDEFLVTLGQVSHDISDIREFRPGDRLQNIHWKMSAKSDDILVKEYSNTASQIIILLPELSHPGLQDTLTTLYGFMLQLQKQHEIFKVFIYHAGSKNISEFPVTNPEELIQVMLQLYYTPAYPVGRPAYDTLREFYGEDYHFIYFNGKKITLVPWENEKNELIP